MEKERILVVDDDRDIVATLKIQLEKEGFAVACAYDGEEALEVLSGEQIHLILLDVMMPKLDGFSAIMKIREKRNIPILVMSAKSEDSDKILGLSIGADDYITKPFNYKEVIARVRSQLRRYMKLGDVHAVNDEIRVGRLCFNFTAHVLTVDDEPVKLTSTEMKIMELFMRNPGRIFSAEEIYSNVWNEPIAYSGENTVMVHIRRIREKIEINPGEPEYLKVVWGIGYKLEKSKKIRAFCYRMIATGALVMAIATAIIGREAFINCFGDTSGIISGNVWYLTEFREYIGKLYNTAMVGYAGAGDDYGFPMHVSAAENYSRDMRSELQRSLDKSWDDIIFYINAEGKEKCNFNYSLFSEYDGHLMIPEGYRLCVYWNGKEGELEFFDTSATDSAQAGTVDNVVGRYYEARYKPNRENVSRIQLVIAVKEHPTSDGLSMMDWKARKYQRILMITLVCLSVWMLFGFIGLCTGKTARQAKAGFAAVSRKIWLEAKVVLAVLFVWGVCFRGSGRTYFSYLMSKENVRLTYLGSLWIYFLMGCLLYLFVVDLKQNGGAVFLNSLPVKCIQAIRDFIHGQPWYRRALCLCWATLLGALVLFGGGGFLCYLKCAPFYVHPQVAKGVLVTGIVMIAAGIVLLYSFWRQCRLLKDTQAVVTRLAKVREGAEEETAFTLPKHSLLSSTVRDLNELESGIENAVEQKNRSNRMRVELLTNVSHDLKTPLTSIINYADLLCEEELSETAAGYATALRDKAYRLKTMVQDVFELSKATSGNLAVEKQELDLVKLVRQTLADMDERIQESGLTFKLRIAEEPILIEADGEKLYRVFQNLVVNALQYSLENSRIHVQLEKQDGYAVAMVKNTSRTELDFDLNEIMERFVRADASRTTEGSGLGLSIVQSFTEACGGEFTIQTDADMFTACVRFPLTEREDEVQDTGSQEET